MSDDNTVSAGSAHDQLPWNSKEAVSRFSFAGLQFSPFTAALKPNLNHFLVTQGFDFEHSWIAKSAAYLIALSKSTNGINIACMEDRVLVGLRSWPLDASISVRVEASIALEIREWLRSIKRHQSLKSETK